MNAVPFDTLKMARKLEAAGFPGPQAAGAAEAMAGAELATKADLQAMEARLEREIGLVRTDLEREIGLTRAGLESKLELLRRDMTIRLGAMLLTSTGIVLAAMRFMAVHP